MKVVVVGAGVAGSVVAHLLLEDHELVVYDGNKRRGCPCGWGSTYSLLKEKLSSLGLDLDSYLLCKPERMVLNGVKGEVGDAVFFDKPRMLRDLTCGVEVIPKNVSVHRVTGDLVVNATGEPLHPTQLSCSTYQLKAGLKNGVKKTVYVLFHPGKVGYGWVFPLDDSAGTWHVGAGSLYGVLDAISILKQTLDRYGLEISKKYCSCTGKISLARNPRVIEGNIVSVGEAAGCVQPLTGEGILPSIESAEALVDHIKDRRDSYLWNLESIISKYQDAYQALDKLRKHSILGMLEVFRVMNRWVKNRTKPALSWTGKLKALMDSVIHYT